jgi:hypothetical protein
VVVKFWQLVEPFPPPVPGCPGPLGLGVAPATPEIPSSEAVPTTPATAIIRIRVTFAVLSLSGRAAPSPHGTPGRII